MLFEFQSASGASVLGHKQTPSCVKKQSVNCSAL